MTTAYPLTGPEAIEHALSKINLDELEAEQRQVISSKKKTARPRAVRLLGIIAGLRKNKVEAGDLMLKSVPVIPPQFRPFSVTGDTFLPGDANEMYRDLMEYRRLYQKTEESLGREGSGEVYGDLVKAVRATYGFGDSPNPKTHARGVKGFFQTVTGTSPKNCYDDQTEILTQRGWVLFRDLLVDDLVGSIDPATHGFLWTSFENYVAADYCGYMLHFSTRRQDLLVTPNHRMWVKKRRNNEVLSSEEDTRRHWEIEEAASLAYRGNRTWTQTAAAAYDSGTFSCPSDVTRLDPVDWASVVGWYAAEGCAQGNAAVIWQTFANTPYCGDLDALFERLALAGLPTTKWPHRQQGELLGYGWVIQASEASRWLIEHVGRGRRDKFLSRTIQLYPEAELNELFKSYLKGDGMKRIPDCEEARQHYTHKFRNPRSDDHTRMSTVSRRLFDDLQEVAFKLGLTINRINKKNSVKGRYVESHQELFVGGIVGRWSFVSDNQKRPDWVFYTGKIYCCQVPTGLLVVRRGGKPCVSGNSWMQQKMLSKPVDTVGRGVIIPDADYDMNEIGIPRDQAWKLYGSYIQRRLVRSGLSPAAALKHVKDRTPQALKALESEMGVRPVVMTRSPAWHKYNVVGANPSIVDGDAIRINTWVTDGMTADFDGDAQLAYIQLLRKKT